MKTTEEKRLEERVGVLAGALDALLDYVVSNRGTDDVFVSCHTPPHGHLPDVVARAEAAVAGDRGLVAVGGRVAKLLRAGREFVVVGQHEPYFAHVYGVIRAHELGQGSWSPSDEAEFRRGGGLGGQCVLLNTEHVERMRTAACRALALASDVADGNVDEAVLTDVIEQVEDQLSKALAGQQ